MATSSNNQYAPPRSAVADVSSSEGVEKATRLSRLGAAFIDGLIFGLPLAPSYAIAFKTMATHRGMNIVNLWLTIAATGTVFYAGLIVDLVILGIVAVLVHRNGQTIGKKLLGIKVVRTDGSRATLGRIFWLRNFVNSLLTMIPLLGSVYGLVDPLMILGEARRCCHDYIADTIVIRA